MNDLVRASRDVGSIDRDKSTTGEKKVDFFS
jgi:hypothetical protein